MKDAVCLMLVKRFHWRERYRMSVRLLSADVSWEKQVIHISAKCQMFLAP